MDKIETLVEALTLAIPQLDPKPLLTDRPASDDQGEILSWMYDHLQDQNLIDYEEWKEYDGCIPKIHSLSAIDFSSFDDAFVVGLVDGEKLDELDQFDMNNWELFSALRYEMPYLEYINSFLRDHGLRLVDLLPFENAYILCVKDDAPLLKKLDAALAGFDMSLNWRDPLDAEQVKAHVEALLKR